MHRPCLFLVAALPLSGVAIACDKPELPAQIQQGALAEGCLPAGAQLWLGEREVSVDLDGRVVFGVGRDQTSPLQLRWRDGGNAEKTLSIPVKSRDWKIERIDGLPQQTVNPDPKIAERIGREQRAVAATRIEDRFDNAWRAGFIHPAEGRISGVYGSQRILNGTPKNPHYGMDIAVGIIDVKSYFIETPEFIAERVRTCLEYAPADRLVFAPDCGLSQTARWAAKKKLHNMVAGVQMVKAELGF